MNLDDRVNRLLALDDQMLYAAELAAQEAIKMIQDPKTPANAKAAVMGQVFRANGLFDGKGEDPNKVLEPHEMTAAQIEAQIARLKRQYQERTRPMIEGAARRSDPDLPLPPNGGVFD
jgi:hypothetical protein